MKLLEKDKLFKKFGFLKCAACNLFLENSEFNIEKKICKFCNEKK